MVCLLLSNHMNANTQKKETNSNLRQYIFRVILGVDMVDLYKQMVKRKAYELGLTGWVKNTENLDRSVDIKMQGEKNAALTMLGCCTRGMIKTPVVDAVFQESSNYYVPDHSFEILDD